jgi:hypothetical protein
MQTEVSSAGVPGSDAEEWFGVWDAVEGWAEFEGWGLGKGKELERFILAVGSIDEIGYYCMAWRLLVIFLDTQRPPRSKNSLLQSGDRIRQWKSDIILESTPFRVPSSPHLRPFYFT